MVLLPLVVHRVLRPTRRSLLFGPSTLRPTIPAAYSRPTVRMDCSILSHDAVTCGGSPEVSSTAFNAQPPDLPPVCLVDLGFAVLCQLAPHRRPLHPVLVHRLASLIHASFRLRLATTPLRFSSPSPPPGWAGDFHPLAVEHVRHTNERARPQPRPHRFVNVLLYPSHIRNDVISVTEIEVVG